MGKGGVQVGESLSPQPQRHCEQRPCCLGAEVQVMVEGDRLKRCHSSKVTCLQGQEKPVNRNLKKLGVTMKGNI
jgi:hypothetical protein